MAALARTTAGKAFQEGYQAQVMGSCSHGAGCQRATPSHASACAGGAGHGPSQQAAQPKLTSESASSAEVASSSSSTRGLRTSARAMAMRCGVGGREGGMHEVVKLLGPAVAAGGHNRACLA